MNFDTPRLDKCKLLTKIEWVKDYAWVSDFNLRYFLYSSLKDFGLESLDFEILAALTEKPCKE